MPDQIRRGEQIEHVNRPYAFKAYDSAWPEIYAKSADALRSVLGDEVVELEHVGSTAVPGMPSKPQVDNL